MSEDDAKTADKKTLMGQRTYRVSTRIVENFPEVQFLVSSTAHSLYHLQKTLYPEFAGKKDFSLNIESDEQFRDVVDKLIAKGVPKGFILLDLAINLRYNRDLAGYSRNYFHSATQEEFIASKFEESKGIKRKMKDVTNE